jgi:hypothetical protein
MEVAVRKPALIVPGLLAVAFALASPALSSYPVATALPASTAMPLRDLEALELRLRGLWAGRACAGNFIFRADGTYERQHYGPGGTNSAGTWQMPWDALRPTLIMTCKTSGDPRDVGRALEVRLVEVSDVALVFNHPLSGRCRYSRAAK